MLTAGILKKAIENAEKSKMYPYRIGCVIFRGKKILSCGYNQIRNFSKIPNKYKIYIEALHAEQNAIMKIKNKNILNGASILVIRLSRGGKLVMSKPCDNCMKAIIHFGFKDMFYSNTNGEIILEKISGK